MVLLRERAGASGAAGMGSRVAGGGLRGGWASDPRGHAGIVGFILTSCKDIQEFPAAPWCDQGYILNKLTVCSARGDCRHGASCSETSRSVLQESRREVTDGVNSVVAEERAGNG